MKRSTPSRARPRAAADQPGRSGADAAEGAPDTERLVPLCVVGEGRDDDREGGRGHDRSADALDDPGGKERRRRPGEPAEQRRDREEQDTGHEQTAAPEQVGRPSSEQEQAAVGERVGAQHPLQALLGEAEVRLDRWQRHEHDRGVDDHHEESAAEERKRPPAPGASGFSTSPPPCGADVVSGLPSVSIRPPGLPFSRSAG
jgi:hypothetical protein